MVTNHFFQVQVKSQVSSGCDEHPISCCMPSSQFVHNMSIDLWFDTVYDHFQQVIAMKYEKEKKKKHTVEAFS